MYSIFEIPVHEYLDVSAWLCYQFHRFLSSCKAFSNFFPDPVSGWFTGALAGALLCLWEDFVSGKGWVLAPPGPGTPRCSVSQRCA